MKRTPKNLPNEAHPSEAMDLLMDPALWIWAANPWENPHWWRARATTRGRDNQTVAEAFPDRRAVRAWAEKARTVVHLPLHELRKQVPTLKVARVPKKDPWEEGYDPLLKREIVVPCILRRVISANLAYVLAATSKGRLSSAAQAYVSGKIDPAPETVKVLARRVKDGQFFYVQLDLKDAFNSLPWKHLRRALKKEGYPRDFVETLMAFVQAPLERRVRGRWIRQPRYRGASAGLAESGTLLNILLKEIDDEMLKLGVSYVRYSDDIVILGVTRKHIETAAKKLVNWVWSIGMDVKGMPRRTNPVSQVKDLREQPLVVLGVEIDHRGDLHMPQGKVDGTIRKLEHHRDLAVDTAEVVVGHSKYSGGKALEVPDQDDLDSIVWGTYRYWAPLAEAEADTFRSRAISGTAAHAAYRLGAGSYRKLYVSSLGTKGTYSGHWASIGFGSARRGIIDEVRVLSVVEECLFLEDAVRGGYSGEDGACGSPSSRRGGWGTYSPSSGLSGSEDYSSTSDACSNRVGFDHEASSHPIGTEREEKASAIPGDPYAHTFQGSPGTIAKTMVAFVAARRLDGEHSLVGAHVFTNNGLELRVRRPQTWIVEGESAPALLDLVSSLQREAAETGCALLIAGPAWLPKLLLCRARNLRRVGISHQMDRLHEAVQQSGLPMIVVGPARMPSALEEVLAGVRQVGELNRVRSFPGKGYPKQNDESCRFSPETSRSPV